MRAKAPRFGTVALVCALLGSVYAAARLYQENTRLQSVLAMSEGARKASLWQPHVASSVRRPPFVQ
jgi:hypothetical protein